MSKRVFALTFLPFWLRVSIFVTEGFFVLILGTMAYVQSADLHRIEMEQKGAEHALALYESLESLSRYSAECTLAASNNPEAETHRVSCEDARREFEQSASTHETDYPHPAYDDASSHSHTASAHFSSYNLKITGVEAHIRAVLDDYFKIYSESGIQLNSEREAYTTGRLALVHLPELYAYITMARDEAVHAHNMDVSYSHLLQTQGAVHRIAEQAENTIRVLLQAEMGDESASIAARMETLHDHIGDYFEFLDKTRFVSGERTAYERDTEQIGLAEKLLAEVQTLKITVAERFIFHLDQQRHAATRLLILIALVALVLQALLLLLFGAIARTFKKSKASASQLAEILAKQDKMFSIIGHELRTPAAALKMQIDELITLGSREPKLKELSSTAEHLLDVLDDMRVGSSAAITEEFKISGELSVYSLCEEAIHSLYYLAGRYKVNLVFNASSYADIESYGRKKQIRQIIINLVKNAIIHSEASRVELRLQTEEANGKTGFIVQVIDNGKGIKDEIKGRLFKAYERGDSNSSGTGLGLYVSRQLADEMEGGSLKLRDNPDGGSIFEFRFTLENFDPELGKDPDSDSMLQGKQILFVEDTPTLLMLGHAILARAGAEVTDARQGKDALAKLHEADYDLVITDIMMPEMDGYELTRELRAQGFSKPIIGVTGATVGEEADRLLDCGANSVLPKPLTLENVNAALRAAQEG